MKLYMVLTVELVFIQGALFGDTGDENNLQYWKTRYLSGSDYGSQYNLNNDQPAKDNQNHESSSRALFSWGAIRNNSYSKSNENKNFFFNNDQHLTSDKTKGKIGRDNVWWPWSNYEEWASSRKHDTSVTNKTELNKTHLRHSGEEKKKTKRRKKKKSKKNKKINIDTNAQSSTENTLPKNTFHLPNNINIINSNYPGNTVMYEFGTKPYGNNYLMMTTKPSHDAWDNNELDNEIRPRYNYHESIPLINTKNMVLDKIKKHHNFDNLIKSYSSRNFTNDINECLIDNGGCEGLCVNTLGSYRCHCPDGFKLDINKCIDINECLLRNGHGPCQDKCTNEWGSYKCSCEDIPGTRLAADGHTCADIDECKEGTAGCSHDCINTIGSAFCLCPLGFTLGMDWKTCSDIDECVLPEMQDNKCENGCENTIGSYVCL